MTKALLRSVLLGALLAACYGMVLPGRAAPDEGKSIVTVPAPEISHASGPCDRTCLKGFIDKYFDALISRCPCSIALAPQVKYTENGQLVKPGEGLWKTFSGRGKYRVYLADPAAGQAAYYGDFSEYNRTLLGVMALRLKVENRQVTEVETIVVREQLRPKGGLGANTAGVMTPRMIDELQASRFVAPDAVLLEPVPVASRLPRARLAAVADLYYQGMAQTNGAAVPFSENCSRRENGVAATNNPDGPALDPAQPIFHLFSQGCAQEIDRGFFSALEKVGGHRHWVADEQQGLVLDLALFDNEGDVKSVSVPGVGSVTVPPEFLRPITFLQPLLFKIEGGKIRQIEGLSWPVPYGMKAGWEK